MLLDAKTQEPVYFIDKPFMFDSFQPEGFAKLPSVNGYPDEALSYDVRYSIEKRDGQLFIDVIPKKETDRGNASEYLYNSNDLLNQLKFTVGTSSTTLNIDYTPVNLLDKITRNGSMLIDYDYNNLNKLDYVTRQNGTYLDPVYDSGNRLKTYGNYKAGGTPLNAYIYTYDANNNITQIQTSSGTTAYEYDELNQLIKETLEDGSVNTYAYDSVGNRTIKTVTVGANSTSTAYTYNSSNQIVSVNGQAYAYDNDGNLVNDGTRTYVYNVLDQLIEIKDSSNQSIYTAAYDETGKRIRTETVEGVTNYFYDGDHVIYETNTNNEVTVEYTWDNVGNPISMLKDGRTYFYHLNGHGDVVTMTEINGDVVAKYQYDAWGNNISQSGTMASLNPYRYAGYRYDNEAGMYYLMARYYNPNIGLFISKDPYPGNTDNPVTQNRYSYANNNPVMYKDPNGLSASAAGVFGAAGIAAASDGPLPIGDAIALGILIGYGGYTAYKWFTKPKASLSADRTAQDIISKEKKGSIYGEFPTEMLDKTLKEIEKLAKQGNKKAQKAKKLLTDKRFNKGDNRK